MADESNQKAREEREHEEGSKVAQHPGQFFAGHTSSSSRCPPFKNRTSTCYPMRKEVEGNPSLVGYDPWVYGRAQRRPAADVFCVSSSAT